VNFGDNPHCVPARLTQQVSGLYSQGKYADAIPIAARYVAVARQKHGEAHTEYAAAIAWLAYLYQAQGRYTEAEPMLSMEGIGAMIRQTISFTLAASSISPSGDDLAPPALSRELGAIQPGGFADRWF
jgi:hypothetical protein